MVLRSIRSFPYRTIKLLRSPLNIPGYIKRSSPSHPHFSLAASQQAHSSAPGRVFGTVPSISHLPIRITMTVTKREETRGRRSTEGACIKIIILCASALLLLHRNDKPSRFLV